MDRVYMHVSLEMRRRRCDVLEERWRDIVAERYRIDTHPHRGTARSHAAKPRTLWLPIPLTVPQVKHLLPAPLTRLPPGHADLWLDWKRRHQALARWYHQRTRLARNSVIALVSQRMDTAVLADVPPEYRGA